MTDIDPSKPPTPSPALSAPLTGSSDLARDVFLSYATQDAAVAHRVCAALERHGISCWMAPRDVVPGMQYAESIIRGINSAKVLTLVLSKSAVASSHVGKEIERAASKQRPIVTLRIDDAQLTHSLEYFLSESQWIDAAAQGMDAAEAQVTAAITRLLSQGRSPATTSQVPTAAVQSTSRRSRWVVGGAIAVVLVLGAIAASVEWHKQSLPLGPKDSPLKDSPLIATPLTATPLTATPTVAARAPEKSVAVLPFDDLSEKKDQAYFSDGLSEELIELLAKIPELRVPARTSSFYFRGKQATLAEIAKELNVSHVLEGSVRKSGQKLRITTQLVSIDTGTPIWSQTFDRQVDDIFKVQDEIALAVVNALKVSLLGGIAPRPAPTSNTEAYTLFLKCHVSIASHSAEGGREAIESCRRAIELDPNFAEAWALLGNVYRSQFVSSGDGRYAETRTKVYSAIQHALALKPELAFAHVALATMLYQMDFEPVAADVELKRALELDPNNSGAFWLEGYVASTQGRFDDALTAFARSRDLDPLASDAYVQIGNVYYRAGRLDEADAAYRKALTLYPSMGSAHYRLGLVSLLRGDAQAALVQMQQEPDHDFHAVGLPMAFDALNRRSEADAALANAEKTASDGSSYQIALIYAARHDIENAFLWLNRAYDRRDAGMLWIKAEPLLNGLKQDPRFQPLLHKMHLD